MADPENKPPDYDKMTVPQALESLGVDPKAGLGAAEVQTRLGKYGPNALQEKRESQWIVFGRFFWGPMPWMIEAAALMSLLVKDWVDFAIILVLLFFNAILGFWHEHQAANALDALKGELALKAEAMRDGKWQTVDAASLVPGDILRIRLGDVVPADLKLIEGDYVDLDQSALTGESLPASKKVGESAYSGSIVKKGEMTAVVTGTGSNTFFGRTAGLVQSAGAKSHFEQANDAIGNFLIVFAILLGAILVAVELHRGDNILRVAEFVLLLLVAAIPVAMPAVLSMTMAMGAKMLAASKVIVSKLSALEELAGIDTLFSDKTGTLTQNKLTLGDPVLWGDAKAEDVILAGALASKAEDKDPIDLAIIQALKDPASLSSYTQVAYVPFDPVTKRTEATIRGGGGGDFKVSKGMPPVIFALAKLGPEDTAKALGVVSDYAQKGYRTLAAARTDDSGAWKLLGILPMYDPPRPDSKETIARAQAYGVKVKMVTGDDVAIGSTIAQSLGLGSHIVAASDIFTGDIAAGQIPLDLARKVEIAEGFGRVFPEHKYAIVKSAQELGHIVGMTGDGVNDAPALKQSDVGIAVSGATEAARAAAALILTAPGLSVIIKGIEEARKTFGRMMGYAYYRIAMTLAIMLFVVMAMVFYNFQALTPIMIIALALLDDIPVMLIAFDNAEVSPRPTRWEMERVMVVSSILALLSVVQSFGMLHVMYHYMHLPEDILQTGMFLQLVVAGHLLLFCTRTRRPFFMPPAPGAKLFWAIMATQVFAALMAAFGWLVTPISWKLIGIIWAYNLAWIFVMDVAKLRLFRRFDRASQASVPWRRRLSEPLDAFKGMLRR
jgi:H+-transporting ATPase